ncbi:peptidyl-prolyl cis-trans isomerase FKBP43 [Argentina anserina]|uniref:peptidyl-prolyl cis-trans isomerase FKBP43 n=1 Tax=Argentina anserina TaxID=57926 RepID=UPI0021763FC2|nr:peptidyl-prolyl cis-trans isomerase FKBP43 [Potentilla anserina]
MAFWGIEVKPGKPVTHKPGDSNGRLHISMATLGLGAATQRSILQCNVGNKSPVYLCCLYPEKTECLQLHLEFDEAVEVMFSVLGPRSVHLAGYYIGDRRSYNPDESESFGEDIADSDTQRSVNSEDEEYDDSFIDDGDPELFPSTLLSDTTDSDSGSEEKFLANKKPQKGKEPYRRRRKKYLISESEGESEHEDDNNRPISSLFKSRSSTDENATQELEEKGDKGTVDTSSKKAVDDSATESIRHADDVPVDGQFKRQSDLPIDLSSKEDLDNGGKPKRKRKERPQEENKLGVDILKKVDEAHKDKGKAETRSHNSEARMPDNLSLLSTEVGHGKSDKPKKKRKKRVDEKTAEVIFTDPGNDVKEKEAKADFCLEPPVKSEQNQKLANDEILGHNSLVELNEKKVKKKKKSKTHSHEEMVNTDIALLLVEEKNTSPVEIEANNVNAKSSEVRTFPSGLHIEELEAGEPDGKIATSGKKITVHYVGKLKENAGVVESCDCGPLLKFRLGRGRVIEGLDAGIDGMRVGGKRRLVIPPIMAYGSKGGKDIPPNSWLIYDVELVKVH